MCWLAFFYHKDTDFIGEVDLPIKIGKFCCYQRFVVVSSLIESCILGVDFLVLHRVPLDFSSKRVIGPELGVMNANNNLESSTILSQSWNVRTLS